MLRELRDDVDRARLALLVAVDQLERPLHRELAGRPLAGVVDAHVEEGGLAVGDVDVLGDLDPEHVLAAVGLLGHREELHEVRVLRREVLQLGVVVRQRAIGGAAARDRGGAGAGGARGDALLAAAVGGVLGHEVRDLHAPAQAGLAQLRLVLGAVQHHAEALLAAVLGHVEIEREQPLLLLLRRRDHVDQLRRVGLGGLGRAGRDRRVLERRGHRARVAGAAARLHVHDAALDGEAARDLLRVGRRVGGEQRAGGVEHRHVPVAFGSVEAHLERPGAAQRDVAGGDAGRIRPVGAMARAGVPAGVRRQRRVEFRGGVEQQLRRGLRARGQRERDQDGRWGSGEVSARCVERARSPNLRLPAGGGAQTDVNGSGWGGWGKPRSHRGVD